MFLRAPWRSFHAQYFHAASLIFQVFIKNSLQLAGFQSNIKEIEDKFPAKTCSFSWARRRIW